MMECMKSMAKKPEFGRWIPVGEMLPDSDEYILLSFDNFTLPDIGRYEVGSDGSGAFYPGYDNKSYVSYGLFVNAWMPLPERYEAEAKDTPTKKQQTNADRIRSFSDEELAEWLTNMCEFMNPEDEEPYKSIYNIDTEKEEIVHDSYGSIMDWLQSEVEEHHGNEK